MWIEREISEKIALLSSQYPALVLTGARQTGKTSLLQKLFPDHHFVSLDLPSHAELAEKKPEDFLKKFPPPLIIDEVQYAPGLFRHLKNWIDQNRHQYGRFILTGSQKFTLMKNVSDSLAGRCVLLELNTLSLHEIRQTGPVSEVAALLRGGFPELHARPELDSNTFYQSYLATYIERDVRSLLNVTHLRDFERFIRICALRSGQILNKSDLARDVGISPTTANEWISVLHASNQMVLVEPWHSNKTKSLVKSPKLYFSDTGLLCHLLGISNQNEFFKSPLAGALWETFVFSEIRKRQILNKGYWDLFFWRDQRGLEVDFLVHHGGKFQLFEVKLDENPDERDVKNMKNVADVLGKNVVTEMTLICRTPTPFPLTENIHATSLSDHFEVG